LATAANWHQAELPQHGSVVVAAKIDAVSDLGREVAALAQLREHGADYRAGDFFPCVGRNAVGRGRGDGLCAGRDRPARIDQINEPALSEHIAKASTCPPGFSGVTRLR
jgi:hypothetical protein